MAKTRQQWVEWGDQNVFAMLCRNVRRNQIKINSPIAGKNLALCHYQPSWESNTAVVIGCSSPNESLHSERVAFAALAGVLDSIHKTAVLLDMYTERAPCEIGAGMANCDQYLYDQFAKFEKGGKLGNGTLEVPHGVFTKVYYSFQYPSSGRNELEDVLNSQRLLGIRDSGGGETITLREYFKELGKQDRQEINLELKEFEKKKK